MFLCIGTTPAVQRVMLFRRLALDEVNRAAVTLDGAAGKSINVAKVLHALGQPVVATGFLGADRGDYLAKVMQEKGIETAFIPVLARTRECITVIDESTGTHTELVEESAPVTPQDFEKLYQAITTHAPRCRVMVMSGTIAPGGPADLYFHCAQMAHRFGALTIVDAQGKALEHALQASPGLVKPNRDELAATLGRPLEDSPALRAAMRELHERGAQRVVITAGKSPVQAFDGKKFREITAPSITPQNPIGSGDAFTAALAWRLDKGDDLGEACRWGCAAGAANALTLLPGELRKQEVERLVGETRAAQIY